MIVTDRFWPLADVSLDQIQPQFDVRFGAQSGRTDRVQIVNAA